MPMTMATRAVCKGVCCAKNSRHTPQASVHERGSLMGCSAPRVFFPKRLFQSLRLREFPEHKCGQGFLSPPPPSAVLPRSFLQWILDCSARPGLRQGQGLRASSQKRNGTGASPVTAAQSEKQDESPRKELRPSAQRLALPSPVINMHFCDIQEATCGEKSCS